MIYSDGDISFSDGATFINNYAKTSGGAITMGGKCDLLALTKDVLFSGNMVGGVVIGQSDDGFPVVENGIANAIDMNGSLFSSLYKNPVYPVSLPTAEKSLHTYCVFP